MSASLHQRVFYFTEDQAIQACSNIGWMVSKSGFTGIHGLSLERSLYSTLYEEVTNMNPSPAALEYIERRRVAVSAQLDAMRSCSPDLFDGYVTRHGIEQLLREVPS